MVRVIHTGTPTSGTASTTPRAPRGLPRGIPVGRRRGRRSGRRRRRPRGRPLPRPAARPQGHPRHHLRPPAHPRARHPFLAIVGNHEGTRDAQWLDLFETLGLAERLDETGRRVGDTVFYGLDYVPESRRPDLDYQFDEPDAENTALVSHGLFTPFAHANWDLDEVLREANLDFDAVLLGDNHAPGTKQIEDTWVTYCGSTERASASERDPRGYNLVEFDEEVAISRKGLDTRDFVFVDVDLGPEDGTAYVRERVREHDVEDAVVVVTVEGDGETVTPAEVERLGDERARAHHAGQRPPRGRDERRRGGVVRGPDDAVRERVREMGLSEAGLDVDDAVRDPELFETVGIDPPSGVLLHGPPGTGKTLMAKAVAAQTDATFIKMAGSELVHKFIGEGAKLVRDMFQVARDHEPAVVFIDGSTPSRPSAPTRRRPATPRSSAR